jgi:hypothetical protein
MHRLQRQSLIGRDHELEQLAAGLGEARDGRGILFLMTGVPGIGKTRLAEELGEQAEAEGMLVVWGRCWENPGAPAYWPWTQALRALIERRDPAVLQTELGSGADWIAEIVPELRERVTGIEPLGSLRSEQARFAMFDAVSGFLRNVSASDPLLIVLDDLHAADGESLALLDFIAGALSGSPVLIVAAYQEGAARARGDLDAQFRALGRRGRHVVLSGIGKEHVGRMVAEEVGAIAPEELVHELHATPDGNPFFAREMTRLLAAEGQLTAWATDERHRRLPLPDTVRETIHRRFEPLGQAGVSMLKAASVIGRDFRLGTLERVAHADGEALLYLVDRARAAGLVVEVPGTVGRFRFTHGLIRDTLYAQLTTAEHLGLHRQVGEALAEVHGDDPEHLAELAHHFAQAAPAGNSEQALDYTQRAGREAMRVLAYERAAQLFALALDISEQLPFDEDLHADLLLELGIARTRAGDPSARETLLGAADAARAADKPEPIAHAALGIHVFNLSPGVPDDAAIALLEEALERIGPDDSALRARLLARIATALYYRHGTAERREALVNEAVSMARRVQDPATLAYVLSNGQLGTWGPDTTERDLDWVEELLELTENGGNAELALQTRTRQIDYLLELDDVVGADIALQALERTAETSPDPRARAYLALQRARRAAIEGSYDEAEESNAQAAMVGQAIGDRMVDLLAVAQLAMLRWTQGRMGEVEAVVRRFADAAPAIVGWRAALARIYCEQGRDAEARRELERLDERGFAALPRYNGWLNMMAMLSEVCAHLQEASRAAVLYQLLLPFARRNVVTAQCVFDGPASRYLGIFATTFGDWEAAEQHFEAARSAALRLNARPFVALVAIDEAALRTARDEPGDHARALSLLDEARDIAAELGMDHVVERAERMRGALGDVDTAAVAVEADPEPAAPVAGTMRCEGDVWTLTLDKHSIHVRDSKGVRYLAMLLANPRVEIHALQLAGSLPESGQRDRSEHAEALPPTTDDSAGPVLDDAAKSAYRNRLEELREELAEAESFNDPECVAVAREDMEFLTRELAGAVGLGGRDRKAASNAERARVAVTKAVRATVRRIGEMDPELGEELLSTIRTGTFCSYEPHLRRPVSWQVEGP